MICRAFALVFIITQESVASKYCREELFYANQRGVPIVPVVLKESWQDLKGGSRLILQRIQWIDFTKAEQPFSEAFRKLRATLVKLRKQGRDATKILRIWDGKSKSSTCTLKERTVCKPGFINPLHAYLPDKAEGGGA